MSISNVISLLGGVALFLFGMTLMGDGLKKVAGNSLELILYKLSDTHLKGLLLGTGVTAVIQSSSATSVMVVGFVNSGMMKLDQAISIILGALVGTSITGWIICLSSIEGTGWVSLLSTSTISAFMAVIGIIFRMFCKKASKKHIGNILLGFSVLMFGMQAMSGAVAPLKESEKFISMLTTFSNPFVGILVGAVFTAVLQSASAAVGILQALSMTGAITFATAYPVILGIAIGAAMPVLFSALGARVNGRRTAFAYLAIEILGAVICGTAYYALDAVFDFTIKTMILDTVSVALVNTVFRVVTAVILLPFIGLLVKTISSIVKESAEERSANEDFDRLDDRFLVNPAVAIAQSRLTVNSMARHCRDNFTDSLMLLREFNTDGFEKVDLEEDLIDRFEDKIGTYLVRLNAHELNEEQNSRVTRYLHTISDFERISDHAKNISEAAQEIYEKKIVFSGDARAELQVLEAAVTEILQLAISGFVEENVEKAYMVEPLEERIDELCDEIKLHHVERIQNDVCTLNHGFVYNDLLTNFERVADHCSNIAIAMIELQTNELDAHGYLIALKEMRSHNFDAYYKNFSEKYVL
ncbi:MAG: Na/Pi cotransporter family protein [Eubacteriales bacterium]|nr:Na/Pi cotransporter family protein [Eubacteriales bacterium]